MRDEGYSEEIDRAREDLCCDLKLYCLVSCIERLRTIALSSCNHLVTIRGYQYHIWSYRAESNLLDLAAALLILGDCLRETSLHSLFIAIVGPPSKSNLNTLKNLPSLLKIPMPVSEPRKDDAQESSRDIEREKEKDKDKDKERPSKSKSASKSAYTLKHIT